MRAAVAQNRTTARETSLQYCWAAIGSRDCLGFENHSCADPSVVDRPDTSTAKAMTFSMAVAPLEPWSSATRPAARIGLGAVASCHAAAKSFTLSCIIHAWDARKSRDDPVSGLM